MPATATARPVPAWDHAADTVALERVELAHQLGIQRHARVVEETLQFSSQVFSCMTRTVLGPRFGR